MLFKNQAGQGVYLFAYDTGAGGPKSGDAANITGNVSLDGAANGALATTHPTEIGAGIYWQPLAQAETNANALALAWSSTSSGVQIDPVLALTAGVNVARVNDVLVAGAGTANNPWGPG
jgi:hypothetical protein